VPFFSCDIEEFPAGNANSPVGLNNTLEANEPDLQTPHFESETLLVSITGSGQLVTVSQNQFWQKPLSQHCITSGSYWATVRVR
jgi:hypothetical protein